MRVVRWPEEAGPVCEGSVVTLGVFDGVHRGHAKVLRTVLSEARQRRAEPVVATFDRHPSAVLSDDKQPCITSLEHRLRLFEGFGFDLAVVIQFDEDIAEVAPQEFARRVFHRLLRAELVVLGFDSRFGRGGQGDIQMLRSLSPELDFDVTSVPPVEIDGEPVSSTAIRQAIRGGHLERAETLLGRPFSLYGTVVTGAGRGRLLGFPTANLDLHNETVPPSGVYATWLFADGERLPSVTSIGRQPTITDSQHRQPLVEVHVIGRHLDLYGQDVEVHFVEHLREQRRFESQQALSEQIGRDVERARNMLESAAARPRGKP